MYIWWMFDTTYNTLVTGLTIVIVESLPFMMGTSISVMTCLSEQSGKAGCTYKMTGWKDQTIASSHWNECHMEHSVIRFS